MTLVTALAGLTLLLLVMTSILGVVSLSTWRRHRNASFPTKRVAAHIALQVASTTFWVAFLVAMRTWIAWVAFAVITAGQVLGDLLMFASYRARHGIDSAAGNYVAVAKDVLGFSRPAPALHAIVGALGWFTMLGVCVFATLVLR